jgi:hypothetical protein
VASQDLTGQHWLPSFSDQHPLDDNRRRERALWSHQADPVSGQRRAPPSGRMSSCHMPRRVFLALAIGWGAVVAALLVAVLAMRWLG